MWYISRSKLGSNPDTAVIGNEVFARPIGVFLRENLESSVDIIMSDFLLVNVDIS
jgi:hypothetical protein